MQAAPPYRLNYKRACVAGKELESYEQTFREDVWARGTLRDEPHFGGSGAAVNNNNNKAQLVFHAYKSALTTHTNGDVTTIPTHVALLTAERAYLGSQQGRVKVDNAAINTAREHNKTWIYVVEPVESVMTMVCVGGMPITSLTKARQHASFHEFFRVHFDPVAFYDEVALERELSLPPVPSAVSSPHLVSGGMETTSPLMDYAGKTPPTTTLQPLRDLVTPYVSLAHLLDRRYEALQNVARFVRSSNDVSQVATGGTALQIFEASSIALFQDLRDDDPKLQHCADVVSYWSMRQYVLDPLPHDGPVWRWFAEHEAHLLTLRMRLAHDGESLVQLLEPVVETFGLQLEDDPPPPLTRWYSSDIIGALAKGISLNPDEIVRIDSVKNRVFLSADHVASNILPLWIARAVAGEIEGVVEEEEINDSMEENTRGASLDDDGDDDLRQTAEKIVGDRLEAVQRGRAGLHLPSSTVDPRELPDIEDMGAVKALHPACAFVLEEKLQNTGHLKFGERNALATFLLDINYQRDQVEGHLRKHFTSTGSISDDQFQAKYATTVNRPEKGMWEDGVRTIPYGMSCHRLIASKDIAGDGTTMQLGCPFQRLDRNDLVALLVEDDEAGAIAYTARVEGNCAKACADSFSAKFGRLPNATWRPRAPRTYYQEGKAIVVETLADDDT